MTELKKQKSWLKEVDSVSLQQSLRDLDSAYKRFYGGSGYPKFKRKDGKNSYRTSSNTKIDNSFITIPKIGLLRYRDKYNLEDKNTKFLDI